MATFWPIYTSAIDGDLFAFLDCDVSCCIYHVEMEELRVGFNHMSHKSGLHSKVHCECEKNCEPNMDLLAIV